MFRCLFRRVRKFLGPKRVGLGFRAWGSAFRVQHVGFRAWGLGFRVQHVGFRV